MTGTRRSSEGLEIRQRKLLFRSWHRGMRELDLIFGRFADSEIAGLTDTEIEQYERLLDLPDTDLFAWIVGMQAIPEQHRSPLFERIMAFRQVVTF